MTAFYMAAHALINKNDLFLVTRRSEINDYMPLKWDIPGGFVEPGESMEGALKREIKEETGLSVDVNRLLYIYSNLSQLPKKQVFQAVYLCNYLDGEVKINPEEHDQYIWLKKDQLRSLDSIAFLESFLAQDVFNNL